MPTQPRGARKFCRIFIIQTKIPTRTYETTSQITRSHEKTRSPRSRISLRLLPITWERPSSIRSPSSALVPTAEAVTARGYSGAFSVIVTALLILVSTSCMRGPSAVENLDPKWRHPRSPGAPSRKSAGPRQQACRMGKLDRPGHAPAHAFVHRPHRKPPAINPTTSP